MLVKAARLCAMGFKNVFSKSWSSSTKRQNKSVEGQNKNSKKLYKKRTRNNKGNYKSTEYIEPITRGVAVEYVDMSEPATSLLGNNATTTTTTPTSIIAAGGTAAAVPTTTATGIISKTPEKNCAGETKGWLLKWTNYIKGYQRRWFVLSKGVLSYYRNQAEINHTCRGTISLHGALIHTVDSCTFVISNGGTQTFHIKAANEVERQSWVTALELAKAKAISAMENEEEEENETAHVVPSEEINTVVHDLTERLENLRTCYDLIIKHGVALQRALSDLESNDEESLVMRTKLVNERATLFRITSNAMINACSDYLRTAESQGHKWSKMLQHEREQRQHLEEMVELMAKQHTRLEQAAHLVQHNKNSSAKAALLNAVASSTAVVSDDEIEFFDAEDSHGSDFFRTSLELKHTGSSKVSVDDNNSINGDDYEQANMSNSSSDEEPKESNYKSKDSGGSGVKTHAYNHPTRNELEKQQGNNYYESDPVTKNPLVATAHSGNPFPGNPNGADLKCTCCTCDTPYCSNDCSCIICRRSIPKSSRDAVDRSVAVINSNDTLVGAVCGSEKRKRRTRVPDKPNYPLNLWSIMKNCIGKDLSKIPMPVNFNEPLSMLQRLTEDYEYANILDAAAQCDDECEQLAYVAAFTISSYSTTVHRTGKPFNPLLGETYECDRMDDLGWRCISEQVSHHPPMAAVHCEGSKWVCWQEFTMSSKFRGKYVQVIPLGGAHVKFPSSGHKYSWRKVTTTVNNIIVGKLWVDQHGDMEITGSNTAQGLKCLLKYIPYSYFSREQQRRVKGVIINRQNQAKWVLRGTWDERIEIAPVLSVSGGSVNSDSAVFKTGPYKTVWQCRPPPSDSEKYYNFTVLACQLNEMEEGIAPTDSRHRPDQRLMELGRWDESNAEKIRLEEKQRKKRRIREAEAEAAAAQGKPFAPYEPVWFGRVREEGTDNYVHEYKGTYWKHKEKQDWSECPNLF